MNNIKKYSLKSLYDISSGISSTKDQAGHGAPFVSFSTVFNNYFLPDELPDKMDTSDKEQKSCSVKAGDIFITRTSETIDELAMSCVSTKDYPKATFSGFLKRLRPKTQGIAYDKYLAFYLRGSLFRQAVDNNAFMTLRASFNEEIFSYLDLYLPPYNQQVLIGDFLYAIEQKKQLNRRICAELESMAKTLYEYWFVQFDFPDENGRPYKTSGGAMEWNTDIGNRIPVGWGTGNIYEIANYINGCACQNYRPTGSDSSLPVIKIKEMHEGISDDTEKVSANIPDKYIIDDGDILFSWSATLEIIYWFGGRGGLNQHIFKVVPISYFSSEYVYHLLQSYIAKFIKVAEARKTTMGHITSEHMKQSRIVLPPKKICEHFQRVVQPVHKRMLQLQRENRELTILRDELLPVLMNGQVMVV